VESCWRKQHDANCRQGGAHRAARGTIASARPSASAPTQEIDIGLDGTWIGHLTIDRREVRKVIGERLFAKHSELLRKSVAPFIPTLQNVVPPGTKYDLAALAEYIVEGVAETASTMPSSRAPSASRTTIPKPLSPGHKRGTRDKTTAAKSD
jgi:hypothetical protein